MSESSPKNRLIDAGSPSPGVGPDLEIDHGRVAAMKKTLMDAGVQYCYASFVDVHGVPKAKCTPIEKFEKMCAGSELFTVGALEGMGLTGPQEDECAAVPDLDTCTIFPWDKTQAWFTGELYYHGKPYANDSRSILKRMVAKAEARGYRVNLGIEPEFYLLRRDENGNLTPLGSDFKGVCPAYDLNQTTEVLDTLNQLAQYMDELGWNLYSFDQEGGRGQYEFDFGYTDVLSSSDQLIFLRLMLKRLAHDNDAVATFMPKPFADDFRSGAHFNISLEEIETGKNIFAPGPDGPGELGERYGLSFADKALHFTAGLLKHAPALTALTCPTYNSYQGLIAQGDMADMSWAPVLMSYGQNNRSAMLRLPANRYCVENRVPDMSCNPYLAAAFHIAAGLEGIDQAMDPGAPHNENAYTLGNTLREKRQHLLPRTLLHALEAFDDDPLVEEIFGDFKEIYLKQKLGEWESAFYTINEEHREQKLTHI